VKKIAGKGVETLQEIVTEFILFVTSEACERAEKKGRHTIQGQDVLDSLYNLGFDDYHLHVREYYQKYQNTMKQDQTIRQNQEQSRSEMQQRMNNNGAQ